MGQILRLWLNYRRIMLGGLGRIWAQDGYNDIISFFTPDINFAINVVVLEVGVV